ncbi:MAG TPA: hypothetical protein VFC07_05220, partial [Verrucomicrobiae bacterium]|nr:hypothetical protein [Verrucomicrobiae bacterium]
MKSWLLKFRISSALDERKPLSPAVERAVKRSEAARRFMADSKTLEQRLKQPLPGPEISGSLHGSIMRAVSAAAHASKVETRFSRPRWIPVSSFVLLILLGVFVAIQFSAKQGSKIKTAESPSLAAAGSALELGGAIVSEAPAAAMSPLTDEVQCLDRDLDGAERFLLASL